jgi:hypothetical protein
MQYLKYERFSVRVLVRIGVLDDGFIKVVVKGQKLM